MCYEFESEYILHRAEEARKALKEAEEKRRPAIPAKPVEVDTASEQGEPVPV